MEERIKQLTQLGFKETRVGMANEKYAFLWHQIEEPSQAEWDEFIKSIALK